MRHEKYSKDIAKNNLNIGVDQKEFIGASCIPCVLGILGVEPFITIIAYVAGLTLLIIKNRFFEKNTFKNILEHKSEFEWDKVEIDD